MLLAPFPRISLAGSIFSIFNKELFSKKAKNVQAKLQAFNEGLKLFLEKKKHQPIMEKHGFAYSEKDFPIP